ncbi:hypothetical protein [Pedobacter faecalis]|uniref:hypothetical protein n=1 Tax=Pedobacter faecalis TaxID=3041495 RepID=UPI00254F7850|nr:hypothetical protein [Pedobacter sp. ELA7]
MKRFRLSVLFVLFSVTAFAQGADIDNFIVKESLLKNQKLAVIATDSLGNPMEHIKGVYTFTVSGFKHELNFNDGVAVLPMQLERSAFVYVKHKNMNGTHSRLLYVYENDGALNPFTISSFWLVMFPVIIVLIALAFRKFIIFAVVILLIYIYFNHSNGLSLSTFFETVFDGLKSIF